MVNNILVGTTAINRIDLHSDNIHEWIEFICGTTDTKIIWFLNVDVIELLEFSYEETVDNFKNIAKEFDNLELIVLPRV